METRRVGRAVWRHRDDRGAARFVRHDGNTRRTSVAVTADSVAGWKKETPATADFAVTGVVVACGRRLTGP